MYKTIKTIIVAATLILMSNFAMAQGKIAVLSLQEAILNTDESQERLKGLRASDDYTNNKKQFEILKSEGQDMIETMKKDSAVMSAEQKEEIGKKIQSKRADLEHVAKKLQESEKGLQQKLLREMAPKVKAIVADLIKTEGIGLLLDRQAAMHVDSSYNITPKVTDKLNQNR